MTRNLRIALVVDPFRWKRVAGDHAPALAGELLGRGHLVRGFGSRPGTIPRSGPDPETASGAGLEERGGIAGFRPDVLLAYDPLSPAAWAAARAARRLDAGLVLVEEGRSGREHLLARFKRWMGERLWGAYVRRSARCVIALDDAAAEQSRGHGFQPRQIHVVPTGVDLARYRPGLTSHLPGRHGVRGRILLCLQRLEDGMGIEELIRAFAATVGRRGDWSLVFAADGPARGRLRALADRLGIGAQVHWLGAPRREELPGLLGSSTLLVAPCLDDDTTGWRLRRALAAGVPVLAEESPRARTWIEEDAVGRLVPRGDVAAWTEALRCAAGSPERRKRWAANARALAKKRLAWPEIAAILERTLLDAARSEQVAGQGAARSEEEEARGTAAT